MTTKINRCPIYTTKEIEGDPGILGLYDAKKDVIVL